MIMGCVFFNCSNKYNNNKNNHRRLGGCASWFLGLSGSLFGFKVLAGLAAEKAFIILVCLRVTYTQIFTPFCIWKQTAVCLMKNKACSL